MEECFIGQEGRSKVLNHSIDLYIFRFYIFPPHMYVIDGLRLMGVNVI